MIAIIADDFSGAAEMAGIALGFGLQTELITEICTTPIDSEVVVISADTRSLSLPEAELITAAWADEVNSWSPEFIYKKIDSVLRGHIVAECGILLRHLGIRRIVLFPANPSLGRTIREGKYFIRDTPVHLTGFSLDPEFPVSQSSVLKMLKAGDDPKIKLLDPGAELPLEGIIIASGAAAEDAAGWAQRTKLELLAGGAGDFFEAILQVRQKEGKLLAVEAIHPGMLLFVSGTTFAKSISKIEQVYESNGAVCYLPGNDPDEQEKWLKLVVATIRKQQKLIIAVNPQDPQAREPFAVKQLTACLVKRITELVELREIFIEGGATAAAVFQELNYCRFIPTQELQRGVVRMKVAEKKELYITVKPGSYDWPEHINVAFAV